MAQSVYLQFNDSTRRPDGTYALVLPEAIIVPDKRLVLKSYTIAIPNRTDSTNWYDEWYCFQCLDGTLHLDSVCGGNLSKTTVNAASTTITALPGSLVGGVCFTILPPHPVTITNSNAENVAKIHYEFNTPLVVANKVHMAKRMNIHVHTNAMQTSIDRAAPPFQNCILEFGIV
jgi:hypothetical protein